MISMHTGFIACKTHELNKWAAGLVSQCCDCINKFSDKGSPTHITWIIDYEKFLGLQNADSHALKLMQILPLTNLQISSLRHLEIWIYNTIIINFLFSITLTVIREWRQMIFININKNFIILVSLERCICDQIWQNQASTHIQFPDIKQL